MNPGKVDPRHPRQNRQISWRLFLKAWEVKAKVHLSSYDLSTEYFPESKTKIAAKLTSIFWLFGAPKEALFDNGAAFCSSGVRSACAKWGVRLLCRCAHRQTVNAIIERHHEAVKKMYARRGHGTVEDAVYLYNVTPRGEAWKTPGCSLVEPLPSSTARAGSENSEAGVGEERTE